MGTGKESIEVVGHSQCGKLSQPAKHQEINADGVGELCPCQVEGVVGAVGKLKLRCLVKGDASHLGG